MLRAQPPSPVQLRVTSPQPDPDLQHQLSEALQQLAAARLRCQQLEMQLRDGHLREHHHRHRAEHDDLTGLLNRGAFRERVQQALASRAPFAVVMLDLDGFKLINDQHGHAAGDAVLRIIAARMGHALRYGDVVSRLGGDEFACLLLDAGGPANLQALMAKLSASIALPMQVCGQRLCLRASLGLAVSPDDGVCVDTLLSHADEAMYRAKRHQQRSSRPAHVAGSANGFAPPRQDR